MIPPSVQPWARVDARRLGAVRGILTDIDDTLTIEGQVPMGVVAALAALRADGLPVVAVTGRPMGWSRLRALRGVLTDIDDTLTIEGQVPMGVVAALAALRADGLPVVAVTGRPMGWSRPLAEALPLTAVVAENGAVALFREGDALRIEYAQDEAVRAANRLRLDAAAARILRELPEATLARDSDGRVTDIAIDHAEFAHLPPKSIARVVALMEEAGMQATVSSIHVNGWFGTHSKRTGAAWLVGRLFGRDLDAERDHWLYVGDSTNDQAMFAAFPLSVGVANLADFAAQLTQWPAFITRHDRGRGFVEVAEALLEARATDRR